MKRCFLFMLATAMAGPALAGGFTVHGKITSYTDGSPVEGQTYVLTRTAHPGGAQSLEFKEVAAFLKKALAERNITEAADPAEASVVIDFDFGIDSRVEQESSPVYGTVGVKTKVTSNPFTGEISTTNKKVDGITGYSTSSTTLYRRWVSIKAFDAGALRTSKSLVEKWAVAGESEGVTNDLRMFVPVIIYASRPYLGTSSGRAVEVKVVWKKKNTEAIAFLGAPPED